MTANQFPELSDLLGSYFHQDWHDEFNSDDEAVKAIAAGESSERLKSVAEEIDALLHVGLTSEALRSVATIELGCFFEPQSRGLSWEQWLRHVKNVFDNAS